MRSIQKRLEVLEQIEQQEICCAFFWVRRGHEESDKDRQKTELREFNQTLPEETYYLMFRYGNQNETYEDFMHRIRKGRTNEMWWKQQTIRGVPCQDYKDAWKNLKKL